MKDFPKEYYVGLDIGTASVGWAVVDKEMHLLKNSEKHLWGSRVFEQAQTAQNRRMARGIRRRLSRRFLRLKELQKLMMPFVDNDDFFQRMNESFYMREDRTQKNKFNLFCDIDYTDKDYNKEFPTIYHLRNVLMTENKKFKKELIYLALHHILKNRGNFLYENFQGDINTLNLADELDFAIQNTNSIYANEDENFKIAFKQSNDEVCKILLDTRLSNAEKIKAIAIKENVLSVFVSNMLVGFQVDLYKIFGDESIINNNFKRKLKLKDTEIEDKILELGEYGEIVATWLKFYNALQFKLIMGDNKNVSSALIKKYEKHKQDLKNLKHIFKKYLSKNDYTNFFKKLDSQKTINYALYVESDEMAGKFSGLGIEVLCKNINKIFYQISPKITDANDSELISNMQNDIEQNNFLPKIRTSDNGVFPYQIHMFELQKILENQGKFYPYLNKIKDKIIQLMSFRIDYYVGPLAKRKDSDFGWIKKKKGYENITINAFNYDEVVDKEACQEEFITRMTGQCTYLPQEKALPKNSIYYCWFNVLNELSNIKYIDDNGSQFLSKELREVILDEFLLTNSINEKKLSHLLEQNGISVKGITGLATGDKMMSNLKPYRDFRNILDSTDNENNSIFENFMKWSAIYGEMVENIIKWLTIFGDNRSLLINKIKKAYPQLTMEQLNKIRALSYTGWGNLSKEVLFGIRAKDSERGLTILEAMNKDGANFMSVLNNKKYDFLIRFAQKRDEASKLTIQDLVKNLAGSPAIKRGIYQSYKIVKEINNYIGYAPKKIFIEFAREEGKKERTVNRQNQIINFYKNLEKQYQDLWNNIDKNFLYDEKNVKLFDNEKYFLYYLQNGKCAYSGDSLDINKLSSYQVDHILPQSLIKDDSLDNKVLVTMDRNQYKLDADTVPSEIQNKMRGFWFTLKDAGLMTAEKYSRLIKKELTDSDIKHFINRQLVETRQIIKNTADILNKYFIDNNEQVNIIPVRANLGSQFRMMFGYYKGDGARVLNDFHHAKDAYLSVFMGQYLYQNFADMSEVVREYNARFKMDIKHTNGFLLNSLNYEKDWYKDKTFTNKKALANFEKNYYYTDCYFTMKTEVSNNGELYNQSVYKNEKNRKRFGQNAKQLISLGHFNNSSKDMPVADYGGYNSKNYAYFVIVKLGNGKLTFECVPYLVTIKNFNLDSYIKEQFGNDAKLIAIIPKYQLIYDKVLRYVFITGDRSKNIATQFVIGRKNKQLYEFIYHIYSGWRNYDEEKNNQSKEDFCEQCFKDFAIIFIKHLQDNYPLDSTCKKVEELFKKEQVFSFEQKCDLIKELLHISHSDASTCDLKKFDETLAANAGKIVKNVDLDTAYLIYNSVTGIYHKKVKITEI